MAPFQTFIGLEIHIHLLTKTKVFCSCRSAFGDPPNTNVCPVCLGYPGVLPAVNREALKMAYMVGTALNCDLSMHTIFERKNYFYPDMPKNYQISQFSDPVGRGGWFEFETGGKIKRISFHDIHLEEDAGKMIHDGSRTLLDYNRAGTSLLEIVTNPDFSSGEEAEDFLQAFRRLVRYLGVCDGNMEEGSLRCDANISINRQGKGLGTKVEIKNLNSSRFVRKAMAYEYRRQAKTIKLGGTIVQETRLWNEEKQKTLNMRTKEAAHDYRYFPEPDIPPFCPDEGFLRGVAEAVPELPLVRKQRFGRQYGLTAELADFIADEKFRADFFELCVFEGADPAETAKWLKGEVARQLARRETDLEGSFLSSSRMAELMKLLGSGRIHANIGRQVLELVLDENMDPVRLIEREEFAGSDDREALGPVVDQVLSNNKEAVLQVRDGSQKALGFLMGQVLKAAGQQADPKLVRRILLDACHEESPTRSE
jgi:aspartyl-tRNA(Asn)/glutamyl-tRNA(Gln) amidotransferase subunit B